MNSEEKSKSENLEADVLIVGAGGAGLAAALTLAERGFRNILVIEKGGSPGGNSALAHDLFGVESPVQKQMGSDARRDDFFKIAMNWAHWSKVNPRIVRAFMDKSGDTVGWLKAKGINFELGQYYLNQSPRVRHVIEGEGPQLVKVLSEECARLGVRILTHAPAIRLIRNGDREVTGAVARIGDSETEIKAKSIIITTGGYAANKEMLKKYCSYYNPETMLNHGVRNNTGDGIMMASEIGADTAGLGHIMFHGPSAPPSAATRLKIGGVEYGVGLLVREPGMLWINKKGRRFIDEGHNQASFASAAAVAQQPGGIIYALFDDRTRNIFEKEGLIWPGAYGGQSSIRYFRPLAGAPLSGLGEELQAIANKAGPLKIANTLDEIASWIGIEPGKLKAEVDEYNIACQRGYDPIFCKDRKYLLSIAVPPFYAIRGQAFICDAIGGIKINERMEVLDHEDDPIPGLFAAGSTTGCWESENYCYHLTGHALGFAVNSGRIAGENADSYVRAQESHQAQKMA